MKTHQFSSTLEVSWTGNKPGTQTLLDDLIANSIVLREELDKLPDQLQDEIRECSDRHALLPKLVQQNLLTPYQASRIEAGKIHGLVLGNYRILDRLGVGGMGVVFKAEHIVMRRLAAIKVLSTFADGKRFLTEVRAVAGLHHPNIVAAMDAGTTNGPDGTSVRYFVMELVPGQDLEEYVQASGPLSPVVACDVIHQVSSALAESHKHDLVHRDIKPSNIRLNPEGQAKLLDFGLARHFTYRMTEPGTVLGTLDYMAPEQIGNAGSVDIRADIYALGGTLFWCLTGRKPFESKENIIQQVAFRQTQAPPSLRQYRPEIAAELDSVVARMMAVYPDDRFATPQAVMQALLPFLRPEMREVLSITPEHSCAVATPNRGVASRQVLIVDDEKELRKFAKLALESDDGLQCTEAANGLEALKLIAENPFDLVLLDIDMPEMNGLETCRRLRENPPCPHLKVIMMSGRATPDELSTTMLDGADDYLVKPLSVIRLRSKIKAALRLKDAQDRADLLNSHLLTVNSELEQTLNAKDSDLIHARNSLVHALAKLVELREGETDAHMQRMERYVRRLAGEAAKLPAFSSQIDRSYIELLVCCAPLHDIGKIGLPDHILLKAGKLEADERFLMQTHTTAGADTLKAVMKQHASSVAFFQMATDIVRHHHERFDGTGYPDALAGSGIPLAARLVAICDVYDALRSRRSYKPALSHSAAIQVMTKVSTGQFDPNLLQVFERSATHFEQIFREVH